MYPASHQLCCFSTTEHLSGCFFWRVLLVMNATLCVLPGHFILCWFSSKCLLTVVNLSHQRLLTVISSRVQWAVNQPVHFSLPVLVEWVEWDLLTPPPPLILDKIFVQEESPVASISALTAATCLQLCTALGPPSTLFSAPPFLNY